MTDLSQWRAGAGLPPRRGGRRRDRRGRGLRGPLLPATLPGARSRAEQFDDEVLAAVERVERRWSDALAGVEFGVEDVPPSAPAPWEDGSVPLGRYFPADALAGLSHRVVLYRRPIETRAEDARELRELIRDVVVEQVAHLLSKKPEEVDPDYGDDA